MKIDPNDPAMPADISFNGDGTQAHEQIGPSTWRTTGLSIRAEIAARFMAAIIGSDNGLKTVQKLASVEGTDSMSYLAEVAIDLTDALITELNK